MTLSLDALDLLPPPGYDSGAPLRLALDDIDEDPQQPRQAFDPQSLAELAETIRERGVRQPVSVRCHPTKPSRWMLNFGARRLRASRLAGLTHIPAFVDQTATSVDQFIENEQRRGLSPLEIALFVQQRLRAGESQADIARAIGKSRQYVMRATALIDPPDWLLAAYREGRCRGMNELHELRRLHADHPAAVETWAAGQTHCTREQLAALRVQLEPPPCARDTRDVPAPPVMQAAAERPETELEPPEQTPAAQSASTHIPVPVAKTGTAKGAVMGAATGERPKSAALPGAPRLLPRPVPILVASLDGMRVRLVTHVAPEASGQVYVQSPDSGSPQAVLAERLRLIGFEFLQGSLEPQKA